MTKRIVILNVDGTETELASYPTLKEMQAIVGGYIEHVRVMDRLDNNGRIVLTSMFANEEGLIHGLPRNPKATEAYQRLSRHQFPDAENPFIEAGDRMREDAKRRGWNYIEGPEVVPGYNADPYIAGPVILFEGWTVEEVQRAEGED